MLMSMMSAPEASAILAPSAIQWASQPASWTTWGPTPVASHRNCVIGRPLTRSLLAVISETTRPAPSVAARRRNGASVTPDIGARKTRLAISISPIFNGLALGSCGPVTDLLVFSQPPHCGWHGRHFAHNSWAVKFHAYTLDKSANLASAVQQNLSGCHQIIGKRSVFPAPACYGQSATLPDVPTA